jgi:hypothetical protein
MSPTTSCSSNVCKSSPGDDDDDDDDDDDCGDKVGRDDKRQNVGRDVKRQNDDAASRRARSAAATLTRCARIRSVNSADGIVSACLSSRADERSSAKDVCIFIRRRLRANALASRVSCVDLADDERRDADDTVDDLRDRLRGLDGDERELCRLCAGDACTVIVVVAAAPSSGVGGGMVRLEV